MEYDFLVKPDNPPPIIGSKKEPKLTLSKFTPKKFVKDVGKVYEQLGGHEWLFSQAKLYPGDFLKILQKMMPKQVDLDLMEGTTIKLIDQFGQTIEVSGAAHPQTPRSLAPTKTPAGTEGGQTATGGDPTEPVEVEIMEVFDVDDNDTV